MRAITPDQVKVLIKACKPTDLASRAFLDLTLHCGLRVAEACALKWADVEGSSIHVRCGKGGKARVIQLTETYGWLELHRAKCGGSGYVFETKAGKCWHTSQARRLFTRLSEKTGIECHPHAMRHAHACCVWEGTKDLNAVRRQLGHSKLGTTEIYLQGLGADIGQVAALRF
jgi:integrase/recombinase XerD